MSEYPRPKLFEPTPEKMKEVAEKVAEYLSPNVAIVLNEKTKIRGKKQITDKENKK